MAYVPVNTKGSAEVAAAAAPNRVVVASNSEHVRMFDLDTFGCSAFIGHTATVLAVRVSPDGRLVATASKDNTIRYCVCGPCAQRPVLRALTLSTIRSLCCFLQRVAS